MLLLPHQTIPPTVALFKSVWSLLLLSINYVTFALSTSSPSIARCPELCISSFSSKLCISLVHTSSQCKSTTFPNYQNSLINSTTTNFNSISLIFILITFMDSFPRSFNPQPLLFHRSLSNSIKRIRTNDAINPGHSINFETSSPSYSCVPSYQS